MQRVRACAEDTLFIWGGAGLPILSLGSNLAAFPPEGHPQRIDLAGMVRDVRRHHPALNASPFGNPDHHAGNIAAGLGAAARPMLVGDGFGVVSQWHDAESPPITPHAFAAGGGGQTALHPTWSLKAASAAATQEAIGGSFMAKESDHGKHTRNWQPLEMELRRPDEHRGRVRGEGP